MSNPYAALLTLPDEVQTQKKNQKKANKPSLTPAERAKINEERAKTRVEPVDNSTDNFNFIKFDNDDLEGFTDVDERRAKTNISAPLSKDQFLLADNRQSLIDSKAKGTSNKGGKGKQSGENHKGGNRDRQGGNRDGDHHKGGNRDGDHHKGGNRDGDHHKGDGDHHKGGNRDRQGGNREGQVWNKGEGGNREGQSNRGQGWNKGEGGNRGGQDNKGEGGNRGQGWNKEGGNRVPKTKKEGQGKGQGQGWNKGEGGNNQGWNKGEGGNNQGWNKGEGGKKESGKKEGGDPSKKTYVPKNKSNTQNKRTGGSWNWEDNDLVVKNLDSNNTSDVVSQLENEVTQDQQQLPAEANFAEEPSSDELWIDEEIPENSDKVPLDPDVKRVGLSAYLASKHDEDEKNRALIERLAPQKNQRSLDVVIPTGSNLNKKETNNVEEEADKFFFGTPKSQTKKEKAKPKEHSTIQVAFKEKKHRGFNMPRERKDDEEGGRDEYNKGSGTNTRPPRDNRQNQGGRNNQGKDNRQNQGRPRNNNNNNRPKNQFSKKEFPPLGGKAPQQDAQAPTWVGRSDDV